MQEVIVATWNSKKFIRFSEILSPEIACVQNHVDGLEPQTSDLVEIACYKAKDAFKKLGKPLLVDDSWISFAAYPWYPGALTKHCYQWIWLEWIERLMQWTETFDASFTSVVAYMDETIEHPLYRIWTVEWTLTFDYYRAIPNNHELPFHTIFCMAEETQPVCMMFDRRHDSNHRVLALRQAKAFLIDHTL